MKLNNQIVPGDLLRRNAKLFPGKVLKKELRKKYWGGQDRGVHEQHFVKGGISYGDQ